MYRVRDDVRRHWAVFLGLAVALVVWGAADVARRARIDPARPWLHMTDFTVYTEASAAFFDGRDPYEVSNLRGWKYLYPPLFALLVAPLASLNPPLQAFAWFLVSAAMAFGCYVECRRLIAALASETEHVPRAWRPKLVFAAACASALLPVLNCLQRGQMGLALVYPLLVGFRLLWLAKTRRAQFAGGVLMALPIALKLTPALPAGCALAILAIAWWSCRAGNRLNANQRCGLSVDSSGAVKAWPPAACGLIAGLALFFLLIPATLVGWHSNLRHLETWYTKVATRVNDVRQDDFGGDVASFRNQSLQNAVYRMGNWIAWAFFDGPGDLNLDVRKAQMPMDASAALRAVSISRWGALVLLVMAAWKAGRRNDRLLQATVFGLAGVATLVVSPVSRGHYFVHWLPAAALVPLWLERQGRKRGAIVAALIPATATILHYAALDYAGRVGLLGLATAAWYYACCGAVLWTASGRNSLRVADTPALQAPSIHNRTQAA